METPENRTDTPIRDRSSGPLQNSCDDDLSHLFCTVPKLDLRGTDFFLNPLPGIVDEALRFISRLVETLKAGFTCFPSNRFRQLIPLLSLLPDFRLVFSEEGFPSANEISCLLLSLHAANSTLFKDPEKGAEQKAVQRPQCQEEDDARSQQSPVQLQHRKLNY